MERSKKLIVIGACLATVFALIIYRFLMRPMTPDQVGYGALSCMERGNLVCLAKFAPKAELEFTGLNDRNKLRKLGAELVTFRGGSVKPVASVTKKVLDSQFIYTRIFENSKGEVVTYGVTVQPSDDGYRGAQMIDSFVFAHIHMHPRDKPPLPGGLRKLERFVKFADYAEQKLKPLGYVASIEYGDDGRIRYKHWQVFREQWEARKHLVTANE